MDGEILRSSQPRIFKSPDELSGALERNISINK